MTQTKLFQYGMQPEENDLIEITPVQNLYYMADIARAAPDALARPVAERWDELKTIPDYYLRRLDWASGSFFWPGGSHFKYGGHAMAGRGVSCGVIDQNYWFAGCVGLARLADMAGDEETRNMASYLLARAALSRHAMAVFVPNLYRNGCQAILEQEGKKIAAGFSSCGAHDRPRFYEWTRPELDVRQVLRMDQFTTVPEASMMLVMQPRTIIPFVGMVPELGRFLRDRARGPSAAFIRAVETMPNWFVAWAEDSWGREQGFEMPECAQQIFMAKAWIEDTPAEKLAAFIDISWTERGDLYYIQKLAETLRAWRGVEWAAAH